MDARSPSSLRNSSAWIVSAPWDLAFLIATPLAILPVVTLLARWIWTPEQIALVVVAFASIGHHLPGFMRTYGERELFLRYRWRFLLAPPLALALTWTFLSRGLHGLEVMLLFWATWHALMQTYGFMRIYDLKRGVHDRLAAQLDWALCLMIFTAGIVFSDSRMFGLIEVIWMTGVPLLSSAWLNGLRWIVGGVTVLVGVAYVVHLAVLSRRPAGVTWAKVLLALTTGFLYWMSGTLSTNVLIGVAMFEIFHAVQYYAIVWAYNRRLADRLGAQSGVLHLLFRNRWRFVALYLAAIAAFGSLRLLSESVHSSGLQKVLLAVLTTSAMLHFYYDGFIWKVRERDTRANLGGSGGVPRHSVSGLVHLGKWAAFGVIAGGLYWLEATRAPITDVQKGQLLEHLVAWTPDVPELQFRVTQQALDRGDVQKALDTAKRAATLRPRSPEAHAGLGAALYRAEEFQAAAEEYQQAIRLDPGQWRYHYELALAYDKLHKPALADNAFSAAARLQPDDASIEHAWGAMYARQGDWTNALPHLQTAQARSPDSLEIGAALAEVLSRLGRHAEAQALAQEAARLHAHSSEAQVQLGVVLLAANDHEAALQAFQTALDLSPDSAEARYQLGLALVQLGRYEDAQQALNEALQLAPDDGRVHFQLGNVAYGTGDTARAVQCYRDCLRVMPEFPDAYNNLGAALFELDRLEEAAEVYHRALTLQPTNAAAHYNLGLLYLNENNLPEARRHFRQAAQLGRAPTPEVAEFLGW